MVGKICNIAFTHLESISLYWTPHYLPRDLQQLISLRSLRRLKLAIYVLDFPDLIRIWERCGPSIRDVDLTYTYISLDFAAQDPPALPSGVVPI